jgi:hypothetical protein
MDIENIQAKPFPRLVEDQVGEQVDRSDHCRSNRVHEYVQEHVTLFHETTMNHSSRADDSKMHTDACYIN